MRNRLASLAAVGILTASLATTASALPIADGSAVKNSAPANTESVYWRGRGWGWGWGGVAAGVAAGAIIGSAVAAPYYYGGGPYYYGGPGPYYYGPPAPAYYQGPPPGPAYYQGPPQGDAVAYCMQRYRSYDPRSGTFLGNDGYRHPCP